MLTVEGMGRSGRHGTAAFQFLVKDPRRRSLLQEEDLPASTTRDDAQNKAALFTSQWGRASNQGFIDQFESRGSSDRQSAKVDVARTMLSMARLSRPGTAQSAQPTAIQRSPFLRTRSDSPVLFPPLSTVRAANPACMTVTRASTFLALSRRGGDEVSMRANCFPAPTDHPTHHRGIYGGLSLYDSS